MGRNFLSGYTHVHFWLVQNTGLTHGPLFISNCLLQSQKRGGFSMLWQLHGIIMRIRSSRTPISLLGPASTRLTGVSRTRFHAGIITIILWSIINMPERLSAGMAVRRCEAPLLWLFTRKPNSLNLTVEDTFDIITREPSNVEATREKVIPLGCKWQRRTFLAYIRALFYFTKLTCRENSPHSIVNPGSKILIAPHRLQTDLLQ